MKTFKTLRALVAAFAVGGMLSISTAAMAQVPVSGNQATTSVAGTARVVKHGRAQSWAKELNLTKAQKQQIKAIMKENQSKLKADRASFQADVKGSAQKKAAREQMKADRENMISQIRGVLTPDQQTKFDQIRAQQKEKAEQRQSARRAAHAAAKQTPVAPQ